MNELFSFVNSKGKPVEVPAWFENNEDLRVADTHTHLDMLEHPPRALARAAVAHIGFVVTIADVTEGADATFDNLDHWREEARALLDRAGLSFAVPDVRIVVGAHPHNAQKYLTSPAAQEELWERASDPRVCGIGEVGLDYYYDHSPRDQQQEAYRAHIALAKELELPIIIHLRDAHEDGIRILREAGMPQAGAILHCFNREIEVARPFLELGCHVSFAGPVTFKKADEVREAAARVPLDRVLTETDAPFMAPEPFRGMKCEPAFTSWTATQIAQARDEGLEVVLQEAYGNARNLLDRKRA